MNIIFDNNKPKYIQIYQYIKENIDNNIFKSNMKLPSKRDLSLDLNVSLNTIINAYDLLLSEGYIYSLEKKGYYVTKQLSITKSINITEKIENKIKFKYDFTTNNNIDFNNSKLNKIFKNIIENNEHLNKTELLGDLGLRFMIKEHLNKNRGIDVSVNNIIIGSGMEMLKDIINLIDIDDIYLENPGYHKIAKLNINKIINYNDIDEYGTTIPNKRGILYSTPYNQFPTGTHMSIARKKEIINYLINTNSYLIEDDFDSEFRINSNPVTSIYQLNREHVIFFSSFSTTIYPGFRLSYSILPDELINKYLNTYSGYTNNVSTLIQLALRDFLENEYASHVNKIKKIYLKKRNLIIDILKKYDFLEIYPDKNYLSLLVKIKKNINDKELLDSLKKESIKIEMISSYDINNRNSKTLIIGYTGIKYEDINEGLNIIIKKIND